MVTIHWEDFSDMARALSSELRMRVFPGIRGTQRVCSATFARLVVDMVDATEEESDHVLIAILIEMPVGPFADCEVGPTCGLAGDKAMILEFDNTRSLYDSERVKAELLWLGQGDPGQQFGSNLS
ncbi:MAG: hypothetical protein M1600_15040 [Firmicutes bacterium]|nr:hypothetical protein [Bacillota bacterium]